MPLSALRDIEIDYTLPIAEIGPLLARLAQEDNSETTAAGSMTMNPRLTDLTCPECRGTIWEVPRGPLSEYRCRVGHTYSARSMLMEHYTTQEKTLWQAIVALEEGASLAQRLAPELQPEIRVRLLQEARRGTEQAATLRNLIDARATFNLEE
jgi:two-component system chemotaxis response regulator CheB